MTVLRTIRLMLAHVRKTPSNGQRLYRTLHRRIGGNWPRDIWPRATGLPTRAGVARTECSGCRRWGAGGGGDDIQGMLTGVALLTSDHRAAAVAENMVSDGMAVGYGDAVLPRGWRPIPTPNQGARAVLQRVGRTKYCLSGHGKESIYPSLDEAVRAAEASLEQERGTAHSKEGYAVPK